MSSSKKIFTGIFAFAPLVLFALYLVNFVRFFITAFQRADSNHHIDDMMFRDFGGLAGIVITSILLGLLSLATLVYFLVHAINNQKLNRDERIIWVLVFIFVGFLCFPVYWYMRIWNEPLPPTHPPSSVFS
ncbi:MAG: hypothetical protein H7Y31_01260 [Chitinophagaceae bacterium]|nr:hypothetical protein [Chitinophagaceae bacterium]